MSSLAVRAGSSLGLALGVLVVAPASPVGALSTVTVTTTADGGAGSLRDAFDTANSDGDDTVIVLEAGATYELTTCPGTDEDANADGDLDHTHASEALTIEGNGATIRQTCDGERVLHHLGEGTLTIEDVTITGGDAQGDGGGAYVEAQATLVVRRSVIEGNQATGDGGGIDTGGSGGIFIPHEAIIEDSVFRDNTAGDDGGGLAASAGSAMTTVTGSTFSGNIAGADGGGMVSSGGGATTVISDSAFTGNTAGDDGGGAATSGGGASTTVTDSTFAGNTAGLDGGGLHSSGGSASTIVTGSSFYGNTAAESGGGLYAGGGSATLELTNSTLTGNTADRAGGVASVRDADIGLTHVTLVDNTAAVGANVATFSFGDQTDFGRLVAFATVITGGQGGDDCSLPGPPTLSSGYNVDSDGSCGFDDPDDLASVADPGLEALGDNGGGTLTRLPTVAGVLVDAIPAGSCDPAVTTDQRGVSRPQLDGCDIGAVERAAADDVPDGGTAPAEETSEPATPVAAQPRFTG